MQYTGWFTFKQKMNEDVRTCTETHEFFVIGPMSSWHNGRAFVFKPCPINKSVVRMSILDACNEVCLHFILQYPETRRGRISLVRLASSSVTTSLHLRATSSTGYRIQTKRILRSPLADVSALHLPRWGFFDSFIVKTGARVRSANMNDALIYLHLKHLICYLLSEMGRDFQASR